MSSVTIFDQPPPEAHMAHLTDFTRYELACGGPDPHMRYVGRMAWAQRWEEIVWRIGCYVAFYNVPSAEIVWQHWDNKDALLRPEELGDWLVDKWEGLETRRERRTARTPEKMAECLVGYRKWCNKTLAATLQKFTSDRVANYELLWKEANEVPRFGRYALLKLLEAYRRYADVDVEQPDIRPRDGWSPREALFLLLPPSEAAVVAAHDNSANAVGQANQSAAAVLGTLEDRLGFPLDYFLLGVLLCEYRECYESQRQYPGRSHDSELAYYEKVRIHWPDYKSEMFLAREDVAPKEALGEVNGWSGPRKELGTVLNQHGYVWSDMLYDFNATSNLARPTGHGRYTAEDISRLARNAVPKR